MNPPKRLYRSKTNRVVAGVAGGLGEYFNVDPTIIRIVFFLLVFGAGSGVLVYLILWVVVPEAGQDNVPLEKRAEQAGKEIGDKAQAMAHDLQQTKRITPPVVIGIILILVGLSSLGHSLFPWYTFRFDWFWPLAIVALGVLIITRRK